MKLRFKNCICITFVFFGLAVCQAQTVQFINEPFQDRVPLPFAPFSNAPAPNVASAKVLSLSVKSGFAVLSSDRTVREVLARWAGAAGWVHDGQHWTIPQDHPVEGAAGAEVFGEDFKTAARTLLSSTDMTDRPVQPCFYSNNVVRVIPKASMCDKNAF